MRVNPIQEYYQKDVNAYWVDKEELMRKSSFSRRLSARLLDYLMCFSLFLVFFITFNSIHIGQLNTDTVFSGSQVIPNSFSNYFYSYYNGLFLLTYITLFVSLIVFLFVVPQLLKGKTIGKHILGVEPFFGNIKNWRLYMFARELMISGLFLITVTCSLVVGADVRYLHTQWNQYSNILIDQYEYLIEAYWLGPLITNALNNSIDTLNAFTTGRYDFIFNVWTNPILGELQAQSYQVTFGFMRILFRQIQLIWLLVLLLSMVFTPSGEGFTGFLFKGVFLDKKTRLDYSKYKEILNVK